MRRRHRALRTILIAGALAAIAIVAALAAALVATPAARDLPQRVQQRASTRLVGLSSVTPLTIEALVATEDERYWHNSGIDVLGLLRAVPYDVVHLSLAQGGSTLTEQLAKNLWLGGRDQALWTKLQDLALALKLNQRYSKRTLLRAYLDTAYFGHGAYGIVDASKTYFGVAPSSLSAVQATTLVGLVQAPTSYDPYMHPLSARQRQADVLRSLVRVGSVSETRASALLAEPLRLRGGTVVAGLRNVRLSPGPAISWRTASVAIIIGLAGLVALVAARLRGRAGVLGVLGAGLLCIALVVGAGAVRVL